MAVREALKELSVEHNKAMAEQQKKFQLEIDQLRRALEHQTTNMDNSPKPHWEADGLEEPMQIEVAPLLRNRVTNIVDTMEVDDSSNDESSMPSVRNITTASSLSIAQSNLPSPAHKRPKRSKSRNSKGSGGPSSSSNKKNE